MSSPDTESAQPNVKASSATREAAPRKKKKRKRPLSEIEINVPDMQTLGMVGVMAGLSVVLWIFAHAGCNYHPPRETRRPRAVTTQDLTRDPKDAAIELQHRIASTNYKGALEIAAGPLIGELKREQASCSADAAGCASRKKAAENAVTSAVVLDRDATSAKVRVTTHGLPGAKPQLVLAEREGAVWKITARVPDAPDARLPPPSLPQAAPIQFMPMPGGSARPSGAHGAPGVAPAPGSAAPPSSPMPAHP